MLDRCFRDVIATALIRNHYNFQCSSNYIIGFYNPAALGWQQLFQFQLTEKTEQIDAVFDKLFRATINIFFRYSEEELGVILDFIKQFNAVSLEEMHQLKNRH